MKEVSRAERIKVAKACIRKGMPISELKGMGIDISKFPPNVQAELHRLVSCEKIDRSIKNTLNNDIER